MSTFDVLVVGASVAGLATVEELRRREFAGTIALLDAQPHLPYDRPQLSKRALEPDWAAAQAELRPATHYGALDVTLLLGTAAASFDAGSGTVTLADGRAIRCRQLVVATGADAYGLPARAAVDVHTLRRLDDALRLRTALAPGRRLVVVGGGFVGAELSAAAVRRGLEVTLVEQQNNLFQALLGAEVGEALAQAHRRRGGHVICGSAVSCVRPVGAMHEVVLANGEVLPADVVVAGLGVRPATDWLTGSGVEVTDGIVCDERGRTSVPGVYAAGDVASWFNPQRGVHARGHHWTLAREQGTTVGRVLADTTARGAVSSVGYFWSDQFDLRLQVFGDLAGHDERELVWGHYADERFAVLYYRDGTLVGAAGVNAARELRRHREALQQGARDRVGEATSPQGTAAVAAGHPTR